ncbi:MAG: F0F1 ATP synthase subunit alpha, partial [Flavobacteriales bacterium]
ITDGQIYLSPQLFDLGVLPAVDVGRSVSRVGGKAQRAPFRSVTGHLKLSYAQFVEMETFARFGARLDKETEHSLEHGRRIRACLKQLESSPLDVADQMIVLISLTGGLFDAVPLEGMDDAQRAVLAAAAGLSGQVRKDLEFADGLRSEDREAVLKIARAALVQFTSITATATSAATKDKAAT